MSNGDSVVVLGSILSALIVALQNEGVLSARAVRDELEAGTEFQPEHQAGLAIAVKRVQMLADALGSFEPRIPTTTPSTRTD